jgi:hypothetical protein
MQKEHYIGWIGVRLDKVLHETTRRIRSGHGDANDALAFASKLLLNALDSSSPVTSSCKSKYSPEFDSERFA